MNVVEKTYGLDPDEVARQNGFQRDPHTYGKNVPKSKWWTGYNQFQAVPIDWFYHDDD